MQLRLVRELSFRIASLIDRRGVTVQADGISLQVPARFVRHYSHDFEPITAKWILDRLHPGNHAVDVGAHIGFFTVLMARAVGADGKAYSFEPDPRNLRFLRNNIAANAADNVEVFEVAAGNSDRTSTLFLSPGSDMDSLFDNPASRSSRQIQVTEVRLDAEVPRVDLAKIDVEGAEIEVLEGMAELIRRDRPAITVEWNPLLQARAGRKPVELIDFIQGMGYDIKVLNENARTIRPLDGVTSELDNGELDESWFAMLGCETRPP